MSFETIIQTLTILNVDRCPMSHNEILTWIVDQIIIIFWKISRTQNPFLKIKGKLGNKGIWKKVFGKEDS